ncbi:MAG: class GN sortase [Gammaproteobacteria bacterium]
MKFSRGVMGVLMLAGLGLLASGLYIPAKAHLAQWLIQRAWQAAQVDGERVVPWSWADTAPVGRLRAPDHGKDYVVLAGVSGEALAFGPGHMLASATPGSAGHTIIGGHRDTHFGFLQSVARGDRFELEGLNGVSRTYQVEDIRVVNINEDPLELQPDLPRLTLITCYPFDAVAPGGPWRYVVDASISL